MEIVRINPVENPLYPLPIDYADLSVEGQRKARVNAARQWMLPGTPFERGELRVASTWFFDAYYLTPSGDHDPGFYDMTPCRSPAMHWDMSRLWASSRLTVVAAPRGSAKTSHNCKDMILCMTSCPQYSFLYATSTHDNAQGVGITVRDQCYENARIRDDFDKEYGRPLRTMRGERLMGTEHFFLGNKSWLRTVSAESRLRGLKRPRRIRIDDPEYDEKNTTSVSLLRAYTERLIFKICMMMIMRAQCGMDWIGTFVSKRHFLWHAMQMIETPNGPMAEDPRFNSWERLFIDAIIDQPDGTQKSCWPEMWPLTREDKKKNPALAELISLEEMAEDLGRGVFNAEMRGKPGDAEDAFFKLDHNQRGKHAWWVTDVDPVFGTNCFESQAIIHWTDKEGAPKEQMLGEFLRQSRLFITVDTAYTETSSSDRRACTLMAITRDNCLFILDAWSGKKTDSILVRQTLGMAQRWRCPLIGVEVVKESFKLYKRFEHVVSTKMAAEMGYTHTPGVRPLKPGIMSKTAKIEALDIRFEHALIKFPIWQRHTNPTINRMLDQADEFNPEAEGGGLTNDDEIDTVSMSMLIIKGKLSKLFDGKPDEVPLDPVEELKAGRQTIPGTDCAYAMGMPLEYLSQEEISQIMEVTQKPPQKGSRV